MAKISFVIPVYNAEKTLRKCVESIVYGKEQNIEIFLIDDCSADGSFAFCQTLAKEHPCITCLRNDRNSGVSFTRNHGLAVATGDYVLFVDSDDWVSGDYAQLLVRSLEENPTSLVACGYTFLDDIQKSRQVYGASGRGEQLKYIDRQNLWELLDAVLLQQLWNKAFDLRIIKQHDIQFDEALSMGEDFQFVIDYLNAAGCAQCVLLHQPLYYYTRTGTTSLMGRWSDIPTLDKSIDRYMQLGALCGRASGAATAQHIKALKESFVYHISRDKRRSQAEKLRDIETVTGDHHSRRHYRRQTVGKAKAAISDAYRSSRSILKRAAQKAQVIRRSRKIKRAKTSLTAKNDFSIISQSCIGGVFYHDMEMQFLSPTINLFIPQPDFVRMAANFQHYMGLELVMHWGEEYPIGSLGDIAIHFMHYETCSAAKLAWEKRKKRIHYDRIFILSTDRDGFDDAAWGIWQKISYPKLLFTAQKKYAGAADSVYFPEYAAEGHVSDLIFKREFYKNGELIKCINQIDKEKTGR